MSTVTDVRPAPADLLRQMNVDMYRRAYGEGLTLSQYLARHHDDDTLKDGLDPFERMIKASGICLRSMPERGIWSDSVDRFAEKADTWMLMPELVSRMWRQAQGYRTNQRSGYSSDDAAVGTLSHPWVDDGSPRVAKLSPPIPIGELVAITTPIRGDAYRGFYLTDTTAQERTVRVGEYADIPGAQLTGSDQTVRLSKFGRSLKASYEVLRRMRIDMLALHISRLAIQTEVDKVAAALDIIVNGDGNANTAATNYNLTTLDAAAVAGTLTLKGYLAFKMKFANYYTMTTALVQEAVSLQMLLLNLGSANVPMVGLQGQTGLGAFRQINPSLADGTALGWTADAPALKIVGIDSRLALEYVTEIGADITEVERWASRQTEVLVMSEVDGFKVFDAGAAKTLNVNA
jgi:hypothetical protein